MGPMIKEKFIVTDGEKVTDEIYRVTGLDIEIDQIIENISSEESNIYFFDKDLSEKPENEKDGHESEIKWYSLSDASTSTR